MRSGGSSAGHLKQEGRDVLLPKGVLNLSLSNSGNLLL